MSNNNSTISNGQTQRKQLSTQIDRLDQILDGLDAALSESVATAVTDVVGQVVKEAVETTIREVLGNPDLLRAALAQHNPPPAPQPKRRTLKDLLKSAGATLCATIKQTATTVKGKLKSAAAVVGATIKQTASTVKSAVGSAYAWSLNKVQQGLALLNQGCRRASTICSSILQAISVVAIWAWDSRKTCTAAVGIGVLSGLTVYFAGPMAASILCGLQSAAATLVSIVLLPLWRLMLGSRDSI